MRHSVLVIVAGLALAAPAVGQERQPAVSDDAYVADLLAIVEKTNSPDALLIALFRLRDAKADPRRVIPAAIRSGERLRIFGNHLLRMDDPNFAHATMLAELITAIGQPPAVDLKVAVERFLVESEALRQIQEEWQQFSLREDPLVHLGREAVTAGVSACQISSRLDQPRPVERGDIRIAPPAAWPPRRAEPADFRTPRIPPIVERPAPDPAPTREQILGRLPPLPALPGVVTASRDAVEVVLEQVEKASDPARFFPLVGPARLQRCRWKCTAYYNYRLDVAYPFPFVVSWLAREFVYVETEHLEVVPAGKP